MITKPTYQELLDKIKKQGEEIGKIKRENSILKNTSENPIIKEGTEIDYKAILDVSFEGCWLINNKGKIIETNQRACDITGYSKEELENMYVSEVDIKENVEEIKKHMAEVIKKRKDKFETEFVHKSGRILQIEVSTKYFPAERFSFITFIKDITNEKQHLEVLKEQKDFIGKIINSSSLSTWISDEHGTAIMVNPACLNFFGATENEVIEKYNLFKDEVLIAKGLLPQIKRIFDNAETINIILDYNFGDVKHIGPEKPKHKIINSIFTPITNIEGKVTNVIVQTIDLTEIKTKEKELEKAKQESEEHEKQFRLLFENMEQGFALHKMLYDEKGNPIDYKFLLINKAFEKLTKNFKTNLIGKTVLELMPHTEKAWIENYGEVAKTGIPLSFKHYSNELKKHYSVTAYSPKKDYFAVIFTDVTENILYQQEIIEAKEKVLKSKNRLKALSNATKEAIFFSDKGYCIETNEAATRMFGYSYDELIGIFGTDVIAPESKEIVKSKMLSGDELPYDAIAQKKNGEKFHAEFQGSMFEYEGKTIRVTAVRDISARKKFEFELIKAKEKAEESDRLKSEFLNNMSHEIRTPMNGILGFANLLGKPEISEEKKEHYIKIIKDCGNQLLHIIDDILEISRLETKQVKLEEKEVCLNNLLQDLFSHYETKAKDLKLPLYLRKELSDENSTIVTDSDKLQKILRNLLDNAFKYTKEGYIELGYKKLDETIDIFVTDTGLGIQKEKQKLIFNRFTQADKNLLEKSSGLGLGLSISKENTELLGGKILVNSKPGSGSTFIVSLSLKNNKTTEPINIKTSDEAHQLIPKILIAEDEEINYLFLEAIIEETLKNAHVVLHAKNGKEAIQICKTTPGIELIFMDLKMPITNGFDAAKTIKSFMPNVPIVAQTAYTLRSDQEKALDAGCSDFISKPLSHKDVERILNDYFQPEKARL